MFCTQCGVKIADSSRFCCHCGHPVRTPAPPAVNQYIESNAIPLSEPSPSSSSEKKGRIWPPFVILIVMFALGLSLFLCLRTPTVVTDPAMPWFTIVDGTLYFNETLYVGGEELEVPAVIAGERVTAISDGCFLYCDQFCSIILPDGIEHIGNSAFAGCTALRGLKIPETVVSLGSDLFSGCVKLEAVCIPYSVTSVGSDPFYGCQKLRHIFYPGPVKSWKLLEIDMAGLNAHIYCHDGTILPD